MVLTGIAIASVVVRSSLHRVSILLPLEMSALQAHVDMIPEWMLIRMLPGVSIGQRIRVMHQRPIQQKQTDTARLRTVHGAGNEDRNPRTALRALILPLRVRPVLREPSLVPRPLVGVPPKRTASHFPHLVPRTRKTGSFPRSAVHVKIVLHHLSAKCRLPGLRQVPETMAPSNTRHSRSRSTIRARFHRRLCLVVRGTTRVRHLGRMDLRGLAVRLAPRWHLLTGSLTRIMMLVVRQMR